MVGKVINGIGLEINVVGPFACFQVMCFEGGVPTGRGNLRFVLVELYIKDGLPVRLYGPDGVPGFHIP